MRSLHSLPGCRFRFHLSVTSPSRFARSTIRDLRLHRGEFRQASMNWILDIQKFCTLLTLELGVLHLKFKEVEVRTNPSTLRASKIQMRTSPQPSPKQEREKNHMSCELSKINIHQARGFPSQKAALRANGQYRISNNPPPDFPLFTGDGPRVKSIKNSVEYPLSNLHPPKSDLNNYPFEFEKSVKFVVQSTIPACGRQAMGKHYFLLPSALRYDGQALLPDLLTQSGPRDAQLYSLDQHV